MAQIIFTNNARTLLAGAISNTATTCQVASGTGNLLPNPSADQYFLMTFVDQSTGTFREIVKVTGRSGDTITSMVRGQEGTGALSWLAGDIVAHDLTAGGLAAFLQPDTLAQFISYNFQKFSSSGTYLIPAASVQVVLVGGGGGGFGTNGGGIALPAGGGAGGQCQKFLTGLTVGQTLTVTIGAGGAGGGTANSAGSAGSQTQVSSGTQTITSITATAGAGASGASTPGFGGTGVSGDLNLQGNGGGTGIGGVAQPYGPYGDGGGLPLNGVILDGNTIANQNGAPGVAVFITVT